MSTRKEKEPTLKERRWAFNHAKKHAIEALTEVLTEEHHSAIMQDGKARPDLQDIVEAHLEHLLRLVKKDTVSGGALAFDWSRVERMKRLRRR